jgi:omega-6 fatty acid desaturase (delta-12 desaturase)
MFNSPVLNKWVGIFLGSLVYTPNDYWKKNHLWHHKINGDIEKEDPSRTVLWTTQAFQEFPLWKKLVFRFLRDPVVFFLLAPFLQFVVQYRFPICPGYVYTNIIKGIEWVILYNIMPAGFFKDEMTAMVLGGAYGFLLFHYQHAVNLSYLVKPDYHDKDAAAILGSTYLLVPWFMKWSSLGIEYHHIHHYSTAVPSYLLQKCHETAPAGLWKNVTVVDFRAMVRGFFNVQWNEVTHRYEAFPEIEPFLQKLFPDL